MTHPTDLDLAEFADGLLDESDADVVSRHLHRCDDCRSLLAEIGPANWSSHEPTIAASRASGHLKEGFSAVPPDPKPGDLWHLEWEEAATLAVVLTIDRNQVRVVPAAVGLDAATGGVLWISATDSPLGVDIAACVSLISTVPLGVLHAFFGPTSVSIVESLERGAASELALASPGDRIAGGHGRMAATIGRLSLAHWIEAPAQDPIDIRKRTQDLGISVSSLAEGLALSPGEVTELFRGQRAPGPGETEALARILQVDVRQLNQAPIIPEDMVRDIERPAWRPQLRSRARQLGISEAAARRQLALDLLPVAARTTGPTRGRIDWNQLIAEVLVEDG